MEKKSLKQQIEDLKLEVATLKEIITEAVAKTIQPEE